ncbi:MAG: sulfatase-like hydrolase/transferase [Propionibacteriaceae bacterium]
MTDQPFNICWIVADDLGYGDLSCYGASAFETPNLDRLARDGVRFTHAHAASSVCTPSRYALLTGRYPWRSPLRTGVLGGLDPSILVGVPTVAAFLKGRGYHTATVGKWHLGLDWTLKDGSRREISADQPLAPQIDGSGWDVDYAQPYRNGPLDLGFDEFFGIAGSLDMPPYVFLQGDKACEVPRVPKAPLIASQRPGPAASNWVDELVDPTFTEHAVDLIERTVAAQRAGAATPLFLYFATAAPHRPCVVPARWHGASGIGARADAICMLDSLVGELCSVLAESPLPTLLIFMSDNGAPIEFLEDGDSRDHSANGDLRGQKADVYEGGHRVPLIVSVVGNDGSDLLQAVGGRPGAAVTVTVGLVDLFATMRGLFGDAADDDGRAFPTGGADRVVGSQSFDGSLVLIRGSQKAVFSSGSGGFSEPVGRPCAPGSALGQFFDLCPDPRETANLWQASSQAIQDMASNFTTTTGFEWDAYPPAPPRAEDLRSGR